MFTIPKNYSATESINWKKDTPCFRINLPLFNNNTIRYDDVFQGDVGSCWFLSALISYLRPENKNLDVRTKDLMKSIVLHREDGRAEGSLGMVPSIPSPAPRSIYKIRLDSKDVYVDDYIPSNYHSNVKKLKCMWFILFEKAMLSIMTMDAGTGRTTGDVVRSGNSIWVKNIIISSGEMKAATIGIGYVVGCRTKYYSLHKKDASPRLPFINSLTIYNKFKQGNHILANTHKMSYPGTKFPRRESITEAGGVPTHCYAIINIEYDQSKKTYLLTMVNPWGCKELGEFPNKYIYPPGVNSGKGVSIITWERFNHLFACVHVSE